jgi:alanyl-tRNA synthetase
VSKRLYYDDAYTTRFEAAVARRTDVEGRPAVILEQTYFYPTSGGQQHDLGTLNGVAVVDVQVTPEGDVLHLLAEAVDEATEVVVGEIDWARRYNHMQQHSGQHLLSQLFYQMFDMETVSVHFGDTHSTLELDTEEITPAQLKEAEQRANELIWENRPIHCYWIADSELARIPLRRLPKVTGEIRIVEIEAYDWSACGGTHVRHTGEISPIALLRTEKIRQQCRVHFLCGGRTLTDYRKRRRILGESAALFDTHFEEIPALIAKLQSQNRELDRQVRTLQEELMGHRASALLASAAVVNNVRVVAQALPDLDPVALKGLAQRLQAEPQMIALLCCASGEKGTAIFCRSEGVSLDAGQLLREILRQYGGGGGGRPDFAQGGGMSLDSLEAVVATAAQRVAEQLQ